MIDTLETASSFGLAVVPRASKAMKTRVDFDAYRADIVRVVDAWIPLTFAANSMNRGMGLPDLYPFVLSPPAIAKLGFVHRCIHGGRQTESRGIRAMIADLRRRAAMRAWS
jgi:hypothetical protein